MSTRAKKKPMLGWREWISLPSLNIPWIKAKVDSGAKTSSIHAFLIEPFVEKGVPKVRFFVHPIQHRPDIQVECVAELVDHRVVSDSGGHRERRYVISVPVKVGELEYKIEITLANRDTMAFRMLLGRSALSPFLLDTEKSFVLGRPKAPKKHYKKISKAKK
jgi:hypothetical protein